MQSASDIVLFVSGIALVLIAFADAVMTTVAGGEFPGPLTRFLARTIWRAFRHLTSRSSSALLRAAGPLVVLTVVGGWLLAMWVGWTFLFSAFSTSVLHQSTQEPATFASKLYFTATSLITTGVGDFVPSTDPWRIATAILSISGLAFVTLAITYLVPVMSAAVDRAQFAQYLAGLGRTPEGILEHHFDGSGFGPLLERLPEVAQSIGRLRTEHLAYPVLHFFHTADPTRALAPRIAALDEALTLVSHGVAEELRPPARVLVPARHAVESLLDTLVNQTFARPRSEVPAPPDLALLEERGIPTGDGAEFEASLRGLEDRRRRLLSYVHDDSWSWKDVYGPPYE